MAENRIVTILGGTGFIGSKIFESCENVIRLSSSNITSFKSVTVKHDSNKIFINALANRNLNNDYESKKVNYSIPIEILEKNENQIDLWIQLSSYYSEYRAIYGEDFNSYSKWKDEFSNYLFREYQTIGVHNLVLPHVYDLSENSNRLFSYIVKKHIRGETVEVNSLNQQVPIASRDFIVNFIESRCKLQISEHSTEKVPATLKVSIDMFDEALYLLTRKKTEWRERKMKSKKTFDVINWPINIETTEQQMTKLMVILSQYIDKYERTS